MKYTVDVEVADGTEITAAWRVGTHTLTVADHVTAAIQAQQIEAAWYTTRNLPYAIRKVTVREVRDGIVVPRPVWTSEV